MQDDKGEEGGRREMPLCEAPDGLLGHLVEGAALAASPSAASLSAGDGARAG